MHVPASGVANLRFVAGNAKITTAAAKLGLPAEYGMSWILPQLIGVTRANGLVLSSRIVTGAEPADWELWNGVESDGAATLATAKTYGRLLASTTGPNAAANTKRQLTADWLRLDPAASGADSLRVLDQSVGNRRVRTRPPGPHRQAPIQLLSDEDRSGR